VKTASTPLLCSAGCLAAAILLAGCAAPLFKPAPYTVDPSRPYTIATGRTVHVVPSFDRTDPADRAHLDPSFNPAAYVTGMVEMELTASGIRHDRAGFPCAPSFAGIEKALKGGAVADDGSLVLASTVNHYPSDRVLSCDFRLYSGSGEMLFEKRCLCMNYSAWGLPIAALGPDGAPIGQPPSASAAAPADLRLVACRMVMQQLLADPDFQRALQ